MTNPAKLLAALIEGWNVPPNQSAESVRGLTSANELEFWRDQGFAALLLVEVEQTLTAMRASGDDVEPYHLALPAWYRAVFAYTTPWQGTPNSNRMVIDRRDLGLLKALGGYMDSVGLTPRLQADGRGPLEKALEGARDLVNGSSDLADPVKRYLLGLIQEALSCLESLEQVGTVALRRVTFELGGAFTAMAEQVADEEAKRKWRDAARDVTVQVVATGATLAMGYAMYKGVGYQP